MAELIALFVEWRQDIDSDPFAHEAVWTQFAGDLLKEATP